jgi:tetratricopeptide (TPR) repeat protein
LQLVLLSGYDGGMRPAAQFKNGRTGATISFLLFRNGSGTATAEGCRKDVIEAIDKAEGKLISNALTGELPDGHGGKFATASHSTRLAGKSSNHDVFAFAGNTATCAEIHASVVSGTQDEDRLLKEALSLFRPDLSYQPEWKDYWVEATAFRLQSQITAAPYYAQALHVMPAAATDPAMVNARRVATDEVVIALGMSGKVEQARSYAERGIAIDPDYPMNYYNLACADAEEGNAAAAKVHLRQAFERKANVIPGERMPNPATDDSILKLRKNKEFWAFVQTLNGSR